MKRIERSALVEFSAEQMYALVERIEDYPGFLPWCLSSSVTERSGERTVATLEVGFRGVRQSFSTENTNQRGRSMDMRLLQGPFKTFSAHWSFVGLGESGARIAFTLSYEFSSRLLARALEPVFDHIADTMVDAFIRRAQNVYGPEGSAHAN